MVHTSRVLSLKVGEQVLLVLRRRRTWLLMGAAYGSVLAPGVSI